MQAKIFDRFNFVVFFSALGLITFGLVAIYSATFGNEQVSGNFTKQLISASIGIIIVLAIMYTPSKYIAMSSYIIYGIVLIMLIAVIFLGKKIKGQTSWFSLGGFGIQPSEFAKVATVLALAYFLSNKKCDYHLLFTICFPDMAQLQLRARLFIFLSADLSDSFSHWSTSHDTT